MGIRQLPVGLALALVGAMPPPLFPQDGGTLRGTVSLIENGDPVHGAVVLVVGPRLVALSDERGAFDIENVPPGVYEILAQREHLTAERQTVVIAAAEIAIVDFALGLSPVHEEVTVTASATGTETTFEGCVATFQKRQESDWSSRPGSVSCRHLEQVVDELNLSPHIRTAHPPRLPLPDHVHGLVALDRSPRRLKLTKPLLGFHASFDRSMILLQNVVQVLDWPVAATASQESCLFHP